MNDNKEILDFIREFSKFGKQVNTCFTEGNCYWFAHILKSRFGGDIMFSPLENHFSCRIKRKLYDITGCCDGLYYYDWEKWENYKKEHTSRITNIEKELIYKV